LIALALRVGLDDEHAAARRHPRGLREHPVRRRVAPGAGGVEAADQREPVVQAIELGPRVERGVVLGEQREQRGAVLDVRWLGGLELAADLHRAQRRGEPLVARLGDRDPGQRGDQRAAHRRAIRRADVQRAQRLRRRDRLGELGHQQRERDLLGARADRLRLDRARQLVGRRRGPADHRAREQVGARAAGDRAALEVVRDRAVIRGPQDRELGQQVRPRRVDRRAARQLGQLVEPAARLRLELRLGMQEPRGEVAGVDRTALPSGSAAVRGQAPAVDTQRALGDVARGSRLAAAHGRERLEHQHQRQIRDPVVQRVEPRDRRRRIAEPQVDQRVAQPVQRVERLELDRARRRGRGDGEVVAEPAPQARHRGQHAARARRPGPPQLVLELDRRRRPVDPR